MTDFESLKQQIVEVVTKDPTVKYIFLGWVQDQFAEKVDLNKILEEIRQLREDTRRGFDAADKRFEEMRQDMDKRFEAVDERFEAVDERFEAVDERFEAVDERFDAVDNRFDAVDNRFDAADKRFDAVDNRFDAADKRFDAVDNRFEEMRQDMNTGFRTLSKKIDILGPRWGRDSEAAFRNGLISLVGEFFEGTIEKWRVHDTQGYVTGRPRNVELDIVMSNGKCIVIEIKSKPSIGDITVFDRTIQFYEMQMGRKPDRKVLIAYAMEPEAKTEAEACGIEIFDSDDLQEPMA